MKRKTKDKIGQSVPTPMGALTNGGATLVAVTPSTDASSVSETEHWQLGLPADTQRSVLAWARPILRGLRVEQGKYIKNGVLFVLEGIRVEIVRVPSGYSIYLWRNKKTVTAWRFGGSQSGEATKWLRGRVTPAGIETA